MYFWHACIWVLAATKAAMAAAAGAASDVKIFSLLRSFGIFRWCWDGNVMVAVDVFFLLLLLPDASDVLAFTFWHSLIEAWTPERERDRESISGNSPVNSFRHFGKRIYACYLALVTIRWRSNSSNVCHISLSLSLHRFFSQLPKKKIYEKIEDAEECRKFASIYLSFNVGSCERFSCAPNLFKLICCRIPHWNATNASSKAQYFSILSGHVSLRLKIQCFRLYANTKWKTGNLRSVCGCMRVRVRVCELCLFAHSNQQLHSIRYKMLK